MALLLYLNYHVKVEHAAATSRDGIMSHNVVNDQLAHTRERFSQEWRHVAESFSLRNIVSSEDDDTKQLFIPPDNNTELRHYMQHHLQHDSTEQHTLSHTEGRRYRQDLREYRPEKALKALAAHPISREEVNIQTPLLEDVLQELQSHEKCSTLPLFVSMANVGSPCTGK